MHPISSARLASFPDSPVTGPGDTISYLLEFANQGNASAESVSIEDTIPLNTTFVSSTGGGQLVGNLVTWDLGQLQPSESGSVSLTVLVSGSVDPSSVESIDNLAVLNSTTVGVDPVEATESIPVISQAILELTKTSNLDFIDAGFQVFYTLSYRNTGTATANNVILTDIIPAGTSFVSATGGGNLVGNEVIWTDPGLVPGAQGQVQR